MSPFAKGTDVPVEKSRAEIEKLLVRYGATGFVAGWDGGDAVLMFEAKNRRIRFSLRIPDANDKRFAIDGRNHARTTAQRQSARAAEERRRWRALALVIKGKLEAVESGIATFEESFLSNIVVPGGRTFGEWAQPQIARAYDEGRALPPLLSAGGAEQGEG